MKPLAISDFDLSDLERRLVRGWVIRRDQIEALIAMARERNELIRTQQGQSINSERVFQHG